MRYRVRVTLIIFQYRSMVTQYANNQLHIHYIQISGFLYRLFLINSSMLKLIVYSVHFL